MTKGARRFPNVASEPDLKRVESGGHAIRKPFLLK